MPKIFILGGGFGGVYTALALERKLRNQPDAEIILVNEENFLLFTPMLHEVASGELDPSAIVNPLHRLLKRTRFFCGRVLQIDLERKSLVIAHGIDTEHQHEVTYDHLVLALGSVTHFYGLPGLEEQALSMKSLGDALFLRNRIIACLEEGDFECSEGFRKDLLTFVIAGGGFAGVETAAGVYDFLHGLRGAYRNIGAKDIRVVLVHSGQALLPELDRRLGEYAGRLLSRRGLEIVYGAKVESFLSGEVSLSNGDQIPARTLVWTAGNTANPLLAGLPCGKERGRILVDQMLRVPTHPGVWALGDCALVPTGEAGKYHPPTAQHAIREAKILAGNIVASMAGGELKPFRFRTLGQLASLGRRRGVAQIFGLRFSGFVAWWLWRTIYLLKLPRLERRIRVAIGWTLDLLFPVDSVQLPSRRTSSPASEVTRVSVRALQGGG